MSILLHALPQNCPQLMHSELNNRSGTSLVFSPCSGSSAAAPKATEGSRQWGCGFARRDLAAAAGAKGGEQSQVTHANMENHRGYPG